MDQQAMETLYLAAVTVAELRYGIACMPRGKRRDGLHDVLESNILPLFAGRVLAFDLPSTRVYADVMAYARSQGRAIALADGLIAATARTHGMSIATRDTQPFEAAGVPVINPWGWVAPS
jgi:predicted nucleic acid-binding protein